MLDFVQTMQVMRMQWSLPLQNIVFWQLGLSRSVEQTAVHASQPVTAEPASFQYMYTQL